MALRSAILGKRFVVVSSSPVNGLVLFPSANHFSISARSYVWPSTVMTGCRITSIGNGHWKESKKKGGTAPAAAGSARDMHAGGADTGASSGAGADPRPAVEAAFSAAPDDPSERDKLNFAVRHTSVSPSPSLPVPPSPPHRPQNPRTMKQLPPLLPSTPWITPLLLPPQVNLLVAAAFSVLSLRVCRSPSWSTTWP
jgi:hypothetical protein